MRFQPLFVISISHSYYTQSCKDFDYSFPRDTLQLLKNANLIARVRDNKLYVLFAADKTGAHLTSKTLRIGLRLLNPYFSNFTDLSFVDQSCRPLYRNSQRGGELDAAVPVILVGQVFSHALIKTARPVTVTLKDPSDQIFKTDTVTGENNRSTISYDLTGQPAGAYHITEEDGAGNSITRIYYSDAELQQHSIFGVVEINIDGSFYTKDTEFKITFTAKQETLKYYIIARNYSQLELDQLSIVDEGEEGRPQIQFTSANFTNDDLSPSILGNGDAKIALFKSQTSVMRQEKARQKIQLQKKNSSQQNASVLIPHLPQPGANKVNADLLIQLSKLKP